MFFHPVESRIAATQRSNTTSHFTFRYIETGGFEGKQEDTSYDSSTKALVFNDVVIRTLTPEEENTLKKVIKNNGFFELTDLPEVNASDNVSMGLSVETDGEFCLLDWCNW